MGKIIILKNRRMNDMANNQCYSIAEIERLAEQALVNACISDIPINPVQIAEQLGISVLKGRFINENMSGLITKLDSKTEIVVESRHNLTRQRFTIAHELGHFILHMSEKENKFVTYSRNNKSDAKESEANSFAAALLMPKKYIEKKFNDYIYMSENSIVTKLANEFLVSETAMKNRLINLGLFNYGW